MLFDLIFVCGFSYYMCYALWDDVLYALLYSNQTLYLIHIQIRYFLQTPLGFAALSWSIPKTYQLFIRSKLVQIWIRIFLRIRIRFLKVGSTLQPWFIQSTQFSGILHSAYGIQLSCIFTLLLRELRSRKGAEK